MRNIQVLHDNCVADSNSDFVSVNRADKSEFKVENQVKKSG